VLFAAHYKFECVLGDLPMYLIIVSS